MIDEQAEQVIDRDQNQDQRQKPCAGTAEKDQALNQQHRIFQAAGHCIIQEQRQRQKTEQKHDAVKNHTKPPLRQICTGRAFRPPMPDLIERPLPGKEGSGQSEQTDETACRMNL